MGQPLILGIIGYPLGHSLSPVMHRAALQELGLDGVYLPFAVPPERLPAAVRGLAALGFRGVNVTIPHKERVLNLVDRVSREAQLIGAANTIIQEDGQLLGDNTDAAGFRASLVEAGIDPRGQTAVILGAGGASRAVAVALVRAGVELVYLANRTRARAAALVELLQANSYRAEAVELEGDQLARVLEQAQILVNATSVGMYPHQLANPPLNPELLHPGLAVVDLVYNPRETRLLRAAAERGCPTVDGLGMLLHQGAAALELWTGMPAPLAAMRAALVGALTTRNQESGVSS